MVDEVGLLLHHVPDVLVDTGHFVGAGRQHADALLLQVVAARLCSCTCPWPFCGTCGARRRGKRSRKTRGLPLAAHDESRSGHRAGNHAQHALPGGSRSLAVHDRLAVRRALPSRRNCDGSRRRPRCARQAASVTSAVDHVVVGCRVVAHQVHGVPSIPVPPRCRGRAKPGERRSSYLEGSWLRAMPL